MMVDTLFAGLNVDRTSVDDERTDLAAKLYSIELISRKEQ